MDTNLLLTIVRSDEDTNGPVKEGIDLLESECLSSLSVLDNESAGA